MIALLKVITKTNPHKPASPSGRWKI